MKPILCVDFDGVLHAYTSGWQGEGTVSDGPVPGAMRFLAEAVKDFDVCVYSSRSKYPGGIQAMMKALLLWLTDELGEFDGGETFFSLSYPTEKPAAFLTIDDRAVCFTGEFPDTASLLAFKPWNKKDT